MGKNYKEFTYLKEGVKTQRRLVILNQDDKHYSGIDLDQLTAQEETEFLKVVATMQEATTKVMKAFRQFKKINII
jgi:uncharacterized protein YifE (UPF0438 family)